MPKGAPKPTAVSMVSHSFPTCCIYLSLSGARTHEGPVPDGEPLGKRVEGNVATGTLGVVVGRAHLARGGVEAAAGSGGREACDGAGEHLYVVSAVSLESPGIGAYFDVRFVGALRGDWQCSARSNGCSCDVEVSGDAGFGAGRACLRLQLRVAQKEGIPSRLYHQDSVYQYTTTMYSIQLISLSSLTLLLLRYLAKDLHQCTVTTLAQKNVFDRAILATYMHRHSSTPNL